MTLAIAAIGAACDEGLLCVQRFHADERFVQKRQRRCEKAVVTGGNGSEFNGRPR